MRTKKTLAILLTAVMLLLPLVVFASAEGTQWSVYTPSKTNYVNGETIDANGLAVYDGTNTYYYTASPDDFVFVPAVASCGDADITVYYKGVEVGEFNITISHVPGEISPLNKGAHGIYCSECSQLIKTEKHSVADDAWVPNDDASFLRNETETGICSLCGETVTREKEGTAGYLTLINEDKNPYIFMVFDMLAGLLASFRNF